MIALSTMKHNLFSCVSPGAAITDCHKLGGLKQQKSASHSSGDQSLNPGVGRALFCLFQLMVAPGVLQLNNEKGQKGPGLALRPGLSPQPPPLHLGNLPLVYLCTLQGWGEGLVFRMDSSSFLLVAVGEVTPHLSCLASGSAGQPFTLLSPATAQRREGCDSPPRPKAPCRGTVPSRLTCYALTCSPVDICPLHAQGAG